MNPIYFVYPPDGPPAEPKRWSFSALQEWNACPKRWWLTRAKYPNAPIRYPELASVASLEGRVVHYSLECFAGHAVSAKRAGITNYLDIRRTFPVRQLIRDYINSDLATELSTNPRLDAGALISKISMDACINAFKRTAERCVSNTTGIVDHEATSKEAASGRLSGPEVEIEIDEPPLFGRVDLILEDVIYDFKTGQPAESHTEQLRFYAMLMWLKTGSRPKSLVLVYTDTNCSELVDVPSPESLRTQTELHARVIVAIREQLSGASPAAKPDSETCSFCPVRQLCDDYWLSSSTNSLRAVTPETGIPLVGETRWADVQLEALPMFSAHDGYVGYAVSRDLGRIRVSIDPRRCTTEATSRARVLRARLTYAEDGWQLALGSSSEVFWIRA